MASRGISACYLSIRALMLSGISSACAGALPSDITFDGYCDGITHIRVHAARAGSKERVMTGTWSFTACGLQNEAASGLTGHDRGAAVTAVYDTKPLGLTAIVVRIFNEPGRKWFSVDELGRVINRGTWSPGAPGAAAVGLPLSSRPGSQAEPDSRRAASPPDFPTFIRFDQRCDGIVEMERRLARGQNLIIGIRDLSQCGFSNTNFTSMGNGDRSGGRDLVGTFNVATQDETWDVQTVEISADRTWIIYDLGGEPVDQGTWSPGSPLNDGPPAGHPLRTRATAAQ